MTQTEKARVTNVQIGLIEVEGLMFPNGSFGIAIPQIADLVGTSKNTASRDFKRLMGEEFRPSKNSTELGNQKINSITINEFEQLLAKLDRAGNIKAQELRDLMVGLSLQQLWSDAFGLKFEKEERQQWVKLRQVHAKQFHPIFTIWLKNDNPDRKDYGTQVNRLKLSAGLPLKPLTEYDSDELVALNNAEVAYNALRKVGFDHDKALSHL